MISKTTRTTVALAAGLVAIGATVALTGTPTVARTPPVAGAPAFLDQLETLDKKRWSVSDGWSNGSWTANDWRKSQVRIEDGLHLTLAANKTDKANFSGGEVQSIDRYGHGYYEARFKAAPGSGIVTGFFTYIGPHWKKEWNEIDVEIVGKRPRHVLLTYFKGDEKISKEVALGFDATDSYHVYGFDWQPDAIRWYVDGKLVHEAKGAKVPLPAEQQKIMISLWGSETLTDWLGPFDKAALPTSAVFTCIGYWEDYRPGRGCAG
ncbi:family 16 glycosylhydrolase [Croceicoccus sp. F390]|uniref:Beta-glucanase n=1 Tax=Croceicoccus esteveae TaxID=3075597 RepID=A0ABU2ZII5_9SPHN|nr:family 16 glycosylhydrolase [Croceicoccus sp. F390]MDT0575222.1 family 16 glycosylhydrolase [Croceicoccus sp. F390]